MRRVLGLGIGLHRLAGWVELCPDGISWQRIHLLGKSTLLGKATGNLHGDEHGTSASAPPSREAAVHVARRRERKLGQVPHPDAAGIRLESARADMEHLRLRWPGSAESAAASQTETGLVCACVCGMGAAYVLQRGRRLSSELRQRRGGLIVRHLGLLALAGAGHVGLRIRGLLCARPQPEELGCSPSRVSSLAPRESFGRRPRARQLHHGHGGGAAGVMAGKPVSHAPARPRAGDGSCGWRCRPGGARFAPGTSGSLSTSPIQCTFPRRNKPKIQHEIQAALQNPKFLDLLHPILDLQCTAASQIQLYCYIQFCRYGAPFRK